MQDSLFPATGASAHGATVAAALQPQDVVALAVQLPSHLRLGTSSWNYPGWRGLVWDGDYPESTLSRHGLAAYAQHPLMRTVSLDRGFYRPLSAEQFAHYARQVPASFRFMVKAPSAVTDAVLRDDSGRGRRANVRFLDARTALETFVEPARRGLGEKLGVLVFQISPLPGSLLSRMPEQIARLDALLRAIPGLSSDAPDAVVAVEVRDPQWLTPAFAATLADNGATYCLGLHAKMPTVAEQLPVLRALWPGPLVCRWNLNARHGAYGYAQAKQQYRPFNRLVDPDPDTRLALAKVIAGTVGAGHNAWVSLGNKAEGSAPLSAVALANSVRELLG